MDDESGCILSIIFGAFLFVLGMFLGHVATLGGNSNYSSEAGLPIHDLHMSDDGTILTFNIQDVSVQILLTEATDRPPNLGLAVNVFIANSSVIFTDESGNKIFDEPVPYQSIQFLEG